MPKTLAQVAALALAALATSVTFAAANGLADQEFVKADRAAVAGFQVAASQSVVVVGRRAKA
jgi:hypothetical protein